MARERDREVRPDGLEERVVKIRRCAAVVKGGRRFSFNALVVVGDKNGRVSWGYGKANEVPPAVEKATKDAHETLKRQKKLGVVPSKDFELRHLRTMFSTGSPLAPDSFDYVYQCVKDDLCLSSISGGTDIISCFALGNPTLPVWRGELQCRGLGVACPTSVGLQSLVGELQSRHGNPR